MEVYDYQRVTPRLRDSQTRSYPVWWSSKFPSTSHQFWSYGLDGLVAKSKPSPLYIRRSSIQHMKQHIFPKSWLIKPWFSAGSVEFPNPMCAFGILEKFTTVWGATSVVHCGKTNANVPETMAKIEVSENGLSPRWHYFKDGLPWFMSQDHHHGLKIWHFQMSQPSTRSTRFETTQRPRSPPLPDELQMSRQHAFDHLHGPLLQGLDGGLLCRESPKVRIS